MALRWHKITSIQLYQQHSILPVYEKNAKLALASCTMIQPLSFVPEYMVSPFFDLLVKEIQEVSDVLELDQEHLQTTEDLIYYYQKTYIKLKQLDETQKKGNSPSSSGIITETQLRAYRGRYML